MNRESRLCLFLHTALNVDRYRATRSSPVFDNETRRLHYRNGFKSLRAHFPQIVELPVLIVDNTAAQITELEDLSSPIRSSHTRFRSISENRFGRWNKGAGNLETLRALLPELENSFDGVFYFEPRLQLKDPTPLEAFLSDPKTTVYLSDNQEHALTGYCSFRIRELHEFVYSISPFRLTITRTSLETHLFRVAKGNRHFDLKSENGYCERIDRVQGIVSY